MTVNPELLDGSPVQRLYIIGTTADKRRLLLAKNPGAKFGSYSAPIGPKMRRIIEELREEDVSRERAKANGGTPARAPAPQTPPARPAAPRRPQPAGQRPTPQPRPGDPLDVPLPGGAKVVARADTRVRPAPSRGGSVVEAAVPARKRQPVPEAAPEPTSRPAEAEREGGEAPPDAAAEKKAAQRKMPPFRSKLAPGEIQALLRQGKGVKTVATMASAPIEWVRRLMEPIALERAGVVDQMKRARFSKSRLGPSSAPVGDSIAENLRDRGVATPEKVLQEGWHAHRPDGRPWRVSFTYKHRGSSRTARWDFDQAARAVSAVNALGSQLAWRPSAAGEDDGRKLQRRGRGTRSRSR